MEKKQQQKTPKEKRRNMEKRKEKSRDAARCRRSREQEIFTDLFSMLPLSKSECVSHLDKASIIRIAISYLKIRAIVNSIPVVSEDEKNRLRVRSADSLFLNALEGFLLVTTSEGDIVFISENVNRYLGLSQVDVLGQSIYELSHPCDHAEIKEMLSTKELKTSKSHFLRMKCTLTNKGRNVNIKSASYKVIQYSGRMIETESSTFSEFVKKEREDNKECAESPSSFTNGDLCHYEEKWGSSSSSLSSSPPSSPTQQQSPSSSATPTFHFVAVGEPISHPANIEIPLGRNTFLSKHSLDMKFTYADERIDYFFGYEPRTLIKKSVFDYHHAQDSISVRNCFKSLFHKGQSQTERYRFLACGGGYAWVLTQATVIYNSNTQKPQSVVCVNFVISGIENKDEIYSLCQLEGDCKSSNDAICSTDTARLDHEDIESNGGDFLEHSPQHLIAQLTIDNTTKNSLEDVDHVTRMLPPISSSLTANDFLINSVSLTPESDVCSPPLPSFSTTASPSLSSSSPCSSSVSGVDDAVHLTSDIDDEILFDNDEVAALSELMEIDSTKCDPLMGEQIGGGCPIELPPTSVNGSSSSGIDGDEHSNHDSLPLPSPSPPTRVLSTISETPKPSTINVFVPFTEDMNTGFLGFGDNTTELTMLKEAPEDLTHLAPTAGDVCVPLDETPMTFIPPDILQDMMLPVCSFLSATTQDEQNRDRNDNNKDQQHECHVDKDTDQCLRNDNHDLDFRHNCTDLTSSVTCSPSSNAYYNCKDELEPSSRPLSPILIQTDDCGLAEFASQDSPLRQDTAAVNHFLDFDLMNSPEEMDGLTDEGGNSAPDISCKSSPSLLPLTLEPDPLLPFVTNDYLWNCPSGESTAWSSAYGSPDSGSSSADLDQTSSLAKLLTTKADSGRRDEGEAAVAAAAAAAAMDAYDSGLRNGTAATATTLTSCRSNVDKELQLELSFDAVHNRFEGRSVKGSFDTLVGCKRGSTENWSRAGGSCKRSRPIARTLAVDGNVKMDERSRRRTNAKNTIIDDEESAIATFARNDSVLMNLLVSGCDLNAGYMEDESKEFSAEQYPPTAVPPPTPLQLRHRHWLNEKRSKSVNWSRVKKKIIGLLDPGSGEIPSLMELTEQDYAVNAPAAGQLLQGCELLQALERPTVINL